MLPMGYTHEDQCCAVCSGNQDISPAGHPNKRAPCRYYQAGNCRRGSSCPFAHFTVAAQVESQCPAPTLPHPAYQAEHMFAYHPLVQTPVYRPLGPQTHPVVVWQPYLAASPPFDPRYGFASQAEAVPDYPDDKSDPSSAESSSSMSVDCQLRMTSELSPVRGVVSPSGDFGINPSPGYGGFRFPVFPAAKADYQAGRPRAMSAHCLDQGAMVTRPSAFSLPWQDDAKKKPLTYKTKPCKFYAANGKCSSGEKCTFIHDPEFGGNGDTSSRELSLPADARLPPRPRDKYEDYHARDFYPITWRVIGGGVMMGGQRKICPAFAAGHCKYGNDCKLAHETELQTDQVGFIEPKSETGQKADGPSKQPSKGTTPKRTQRRKSTKASSPETEPREIQPPPTPHPQRPKLPALEGIKSTGKKEDTAGAPSVRDTPTSPVHRRTQSMSMVLTSPPPLDATPSNYAAEL